VWLFFCLTVGPAPRFPAPSSSFFQGTQAAGQGRLGNRHSLPSFPSPIALPRSRPQGHAKERHPCSRYPAHTIALLLRYKVHQSGACHEERAGHPATLHEMIVGSTDAERHERLDSRNEGRELKPRERVR